MPSVWPARHALGGWVSEPTSRVRQRDSDHTPLNPFATIASCGDTSRLRPHAERPAHKTAEASRIQVTAGGGTTRVIASTLPEIHHLVKEGLVEEGLVDDVRVVVLLRGFFAILTIHPNLRSFTACRSPLTRSTTWRLFKRLRKEKRPSGSWWTTRTRCLLCNSTTRRSAVLTSGTSSSRSTGEEGKSDDVSPPR